jgi:hypothetical protein
VDLDSSNKSSSKQLLFLKETASGAQKKDRIFSVDIYDNLKKIERERLFDILQAFTAMDYDEIIMDFGGSESEQLPTLFSVDFSIHEFKEFESSVQAKFVFNIVIAGGTLFAPCMDYAKNLIKIIDGRFEVKLFINEMTFASQQSNRLLDDLAKYLSAQPSKIPTVKFGNIQTDRSSGQSIAENIRTGKGLDGLTSPAAKLVLKRELAKI